MVWVLLLSRGVCGKRSPGRGHPGMDMASSPATCKCFPNAHILGMNAHSVYLISGLRKGKRRRKKRESVGETA